VSALVIQGGAAFHGDPAAARPGDVFVDGGLVVAEAPAGAEVLDARGCLVLPGFVVAHHHLYSALARGMPGPSEAPASFVEVLERVWWRLDRALDGDLVELSALAGTLEALTAGVTGIVDHHASPAAIGGSLDRMAAGVVAAGGRAVLCYEATDRHGDEGFAAGLEENRRFLLGAKHAHIRAMVGGHAPFTLSDPHLAALAELARAEETLVHIHVAEDAHDQRDAAARGAPDVTARLERAGLLDGGRAVIAHGVHLSPAEIARVSGSGAWLTHQPRSNMNNHVGYLGQARAASRVALGTDGINGDLLAEAQAAYFRLREHDAAGAAETVWSWLGGSWRLLSQAFGLPPRQGFGWLDPGCPADVIVLDYEAATPVHAGSLPWHVAFGLGARHVRDVIVGGELVVRGRRPTRVDARDLTRNVHEGAQRLWSRMAALP
jgi:putative selenium metabolism protein SsnA